MQSEKKEKSPEKLVIPLFEIVAYPGSRTKFPVDKATGELLLASMTDAGGWYAIGLTVKSGTRPSDLTTESLYKTGNLFRIMHTQPADDGYLVCAEVEKRVKVVSLIPREGHFFAALEQVPDLQDLEADLEARILTDVKNTLHEISRRFSGSEQFTRPIDRMDSIDRIMGFVMPFLPANLSEKQELLEIASVRQRYITFLELLIKTRENIKIRIEMAEKISDRVSKSNREAMLREQLKMIQEELGESAGVPAMPGIVRKSNLRRCRMIYVRRLLQR